MFGLVGCEISRPASVGAGVQDNNRVRSDFGPITILYSRHKDVIGMNPHFADNPPR